MWARPHRSFVSTEACNLEVPGSNPCQVRIFVIVVCIYSAPQTVQSPEVYSAAYGTVFK